MSALGAVADGGSIELEDCDVTVSGGTHGDVRALQVRGGGSIKVSGASSICTLDAKHGHTTDVETSAMPPDEPPLRPVRLTGGSVEMVDCGVPSHPPDPTLLEAPLSEAWWVLASAAAVVTALIILAAR
jgi:hypothetical protein